MKKIKLLFVMLSVVFILCSCGANIDNVSIDYGESTLYSQQDMDDAIELILDDFKGKGSGFTLHTISYVSDRYSMSQLEYYKENQSGVDECIVFYTSFMTPDRDTGFTPNQIHTAWEYKLVRNNGGQWRIVGQGHG